MLFWALKRETQLSQDYHVETSPVPGGIKAVFRTRDGFTVGSFENRRQDVGDRRPLESPQVYDETAMAEILNHWGDAQ